MDKSFIDLYLKARMASLSENLHPELNEYWDRKKVLPVEKSLLLSKQRMTSTKKRLKRKL